MNCTSNDLLLYAITDRKFQNRDVLIWQIEEAIIGGATMIQLREKNLSFDEFLSEAIEVKKVTNKYNVPLIINDNVEIAKMSAADGVHLGQGDTSVTDARNILGNDKIIGVTTRTVQQAKAAESNGADYIGVGAVFATSTKLDAKPIDHNILKEICDSVSIPAVAIGGISPKNIRLLTGTHISGVAVVSAIFLQDDIKSAAQGLLKQARQTVIQGAIFDLDGTLVDSMPYWDTIASDFLKSYNKQMNPEHIEPLRKMLLIDAAKLLKKEYSLSPSTEEIFSEINHTISSYYFNEITLKPGVAEMLENLKNVKKCVCTLTDSILTRAVLERNGILDYFDEIVSAVDFDMGKDTPKIYEIAREAIGTPKEFTYIFEDADYAIKTAKDGNFTVVGVFDSLSPREQIEPLCDLYTVDYSDWK